MNANDRGKGERSLAPVVVGLVVACVLLSNTGTFAQGTY